MNDERKEPERYEVVVQYDNKKLYLSFVEH